MIDTLLEAKLISPKEFKIYQLFTSDLGRECFRTMMDELFWEEPAEEHFNHDTFAFNDGRRSILRGIKATIEKVEHMIHKQNLEAQSND